MEINGVDRCLGCMEDKSGAQVCPHCGFDEAAEHTQPLSLAPGEVLNQQYIVGRMLGHGGFGITYLAWDKRLNTRVAIKEYMPRDQVTRARDGRSVAAFQGEATEQFAYGLKKFLDEARNLARFGDHPGIVSVLGYFEAHGTAYMVMQYVDGMDLKAYLSQVGGRLPPQAALGIIAPVLDALRTVHDAGLLHRDMSPDNVYVTRDSRIMILDFGAARDALGSHSRSLAMIHKEGFSPEEQYRVSGDQGPWTDIYAVAATLYCMLTGKAPPDAMERLAADSLEPPTRLGVALAPHQEAALMRALAVRAPDRYQDIRSFQTALLAPTPPPQTDVPPPAGADTRAGAAQSAHSGTPGLGKQPGPPPGNDGGKRWIIPTLLVLVAILVVLLVVLLTPSAPAPQRPFASPPTQNDNGPSAAELLAQTERERERLEELRREREAEQERLREERSARQREQEQAAELTRQRQLELDRAATAAADALRQYYEYVNSGATASAMALWYEVKKPDKLRGLINGTRSIEVLDIDTISLSESNMRARIPVKVRSTSNNGRTECWSGSIFMNKYRGSWKIETMKLDKTYC